MEKSTQGFIYFLMCASSTFLSSFLQPVIQKGYAIFKDALIPKTNVGIARGEIIENTTLFPLRNRFIFEKKCGTHGKQFVPAEYKTSLPSAAGFSFFTMWTQPREKTENTVTCVCACVCVGVKTR